MTKSLPELDFDVIDAATRVVRAWESGAFDAYGDCDTLIALRDAIDARRDQWEGIRRKQLLGEELRRQ